MLTYCTGIIAIRPKLASPQVLLDCGLSSEYLAAGDALEYLHNSAYGNLRMCSAQYVDMIVIHAHPLYFYFISFLDSYSYLSNYFHNIPIQQGLTIFHWKHDVIVYRPRTVISLIYLSSLFHAQSLTHKLTQASCGELQVKC